MKLLEIVDDRKHFCREYRLLGKKIFTKNDHSELYRQYRKYQDCALMAYKLLGFCDVKTCKPATGELRARQDRMTGVLLSFDRFARENGITYWLDFGTLLGAVRHQGFIPWDYDTDVCMLREDLYKHIDRIQEFIENNCGLKLRPAGVYNNYFAHFQSDDEVLSFDIFPMDRFKTSADPLTISAQIKAIRGIIKSKTSDGLLSPANYRKVLSNLIDDELYRRFADENGRDVLTYCPDFGFSQENLVLDYLDVFPTKKLNFEGGELVVPQNYRKVLQQRYGDIDSFPPLMMEYENWNEHAFGSMSYPPGLHSTYSTDIDTRYATAVLDGKQS